VSRRIRTRPLHHLVDQLHQLVGVGVRVAFLDVPDDAVEHLSAYCLVDKLRAPLQSDGAGQEDKKRAADTETASRPFARSTSCSLTS